LPKRFGVALSGIGIDCQKRNLIETDTDAVDIYVHTRTVTSD
jgi:hypothetical protein